MAVNNRLDDIVRLTITRETTAISTASFNIPLALVDTVAFEERARIYTSASAVGEDFEDGSPQYNLITKLMSGRNRPTYVVVGRRAASSVEYSIDFDGISGTTYSIMVNDVPLTYISEPDDTNTEVLAGLDAAYDAYVASVETPEFSFTATDDGFVVAPVGVDAPVVVNGLVNVAQGAISSDESWVDALEATEMVDNTWYAMVAQTHEEADVLALAQAIEARKKLYGTSTQDVQVYGVGNTDIVSQLNAFNYENTFVITTPFADEDFPEAAWIGDQLPLTPGSNNWAHKGLSGVRAANITDTQYFNALRKNANIYIPIAGVDTTLDGKVASGEYIDVIIGIHWLHARLQEAIFFRLRNSRKIPMTRTGSSIIESEIRGVLAIGVSTGLIADDTPIVVTAPDPLRIPANMRAQRILGDFTFRVRLAGGVNRVIVAGVVGI